MAVEKDEGLAYSTRRAIPRPIDEVGFNGMAILIRNNVTAVSTTSASIRNVRKALPTSERPYNAFA